MNRVMPDLDSEPQVPRRVKGQAVHSLGSMGSSVARWLNSLARSNIARFKGATWFLGSRQPPFLFTSCRETHVQ